ncbi:uncharacterized protein K489DRAFT_369610 [Dissoconium aciculare CBS 342.82]|jgi:hypothetical protein|uniref:Uncharacterized protein n=1 Tax=Dissoconium aciculare CBS 342.82 TaxID=1314786 RepID=A0A6J3MD52_9PEZI|nr:uncharacterized protein K489DRAFT_369610 [Dissoconium aciculare CBS 342.82]KAF1824772.1 hypothetical protein K489DRAFT_369610 [Dissoconium aciculare CBS 342.82]
MAGDDKTKVTINGSTSGYNPTTQDNITMALLQSGGVTRIQNAFQQRLDEAGWTQNLREYVERLFRSGDATTYDEALRMAMQHINMPSADDDSATANGNGHADAPNLTIPRDAAKGAAETVKKELAKVVKMDK